MARQYCLFQSVSEAMVRDCKSHRHLNVKEVGELSEAGEIEFYDLHAEKPVPTYIVRSPTFRNVQVPGALIAQRAAGAWKEHAGEVRWAKGKISEYGLVRSWIRLDRVFYDNEGLRWSAKPLAGLPNVQVLFFALDFESGKSLEEYRNWMRLGLMTEIARKPKTVATMKRWQWKQALTALDRNWTGIVSSYRAGPFSAALTQSKPSELPSLVFRETLEALA
jgi:hypothetical protein